MAARDVNQPVLVNKAPSDDPEDDNGVASNGKSLTGQGNSNPTKLNGQGNHQPTQAQNQNQNQNVNLNNQATNIKPQQTLVPANVQAQPVTEDGVERVGKFAARKTGKRAPDVPGGAKLHNVSTPASTAQIKSSESSNNIANNGNNNPPSGLPPLNQQQNNMNVNAVPATQNVAPLPNQAATNPPVPLTVSYSEPPPSGIPFNPQQMITQPMYNIPPQLQQPQHIPRMQYVQPVMGQSTLTSAGLAEHNGGLQYPVRSQHNNTPLSMASNPSVGNVAMRLNRSLRAGSNSVSEGAFFVDPGPTPMNRVGSNVSFTESQERDMIAADAQMALEKWNEHQRLINQAQGELQTFLINHLGRYQQQSIKIADLERQVIDLQTKNNELSRRYGSAVYEIEFLKQQHFQGYQQQQYTLPNLQQQQQQYSQLPQQAYLMPRNVQWVNTGPPMSSMPMNADNPQTMRENTSPTIGLDITYGQPPPLQQQQGLSQQSQMLQAPIPQHEEDQPQNQNGQKEMTHLVSDALQSDGTMGGGHAKMINNSPPPPPPSTPIHAQVITSPVKQSQQAGRSMLQQRQVPAQQSQAPQAQSRAQGQGAQPAQQQPQKGGQPAQQPPQNTQQPRAQGQGAQSTQQQSTQQPPQNTQQPRAQGQGAQPAQQQSTQQPPQNTQQPRAQGQGAQSTQQQSTQQPPQNTQQPRAQGQGAQPAQQQPLNTNAPTQQQPKAQGQGGQNASTQQRPQTFVQHSAQPQQSRQGQPPSSQQQKPVTQPPTTQQQPTPQHSLSVVQQAQMQVQQQQQSRMQVRPPTPPDDVGGSVPISHFSMGNGNLPSEGGPASVAGNPNNGQGNIQSNPIRRPPNGTESSNVLNLSEKDVDLC